ncbi:MAG: hypothetical protein E6J14_15435 [Chloroflexi bacterium]|nr:MAG: hypothetical protein E6J14_15435 [Chloroflexota bacterium]
MSALHYLENLVLEPDGKEGRWRDTYWSAFQQMRVPLMLEWGLELTGAWQTPIGAGHGNEFIVLWSAMDISAWERLCAESTGVTTHPDLRRWRSVAADYLHHGTGRLLLESPAHDLTVLGRRASNGGSTASRPVRDEWLYELELTAFAPDGRGGRWREDYWPEFRDRLHPTLTRLGLEVVGAWETAPGCGALDECAFLYRAPDFSAWHRFLEAVRGSTRDPVLRQRRGEMWVWREQWLTRLLLPAAGHAASLLHRELE